MSSQTGNRCEKGHNMDPAWDTCPYCEAEKNSNQRSATEVGFSSAEANGRRTSMGGTIAGGGGAGEGGGRETRAMPDSGGIPNAPIGSGDTRQIVGTLITYSWNAWGDIFNIRLGKNYIGARQVCEIEIDEKDPRVSLVHALILCRPNSSANGVRFDLIDQQSSNGTYMNGELAPLQGVTLPNYAKIKTGDTEWTFIKIVP